MRYVDVSKKRKSRWPWALGALVLIAAGWGVTVLLAPPPDQERAPVDAAAVDTLPPAAVPASPDADFSTGAHRDISEIAPLDEEDAGETVRAHGEVVATGSQAFWIVAGSEILRVDSERRPRRGDTLSVEGTLRPADRSETTQRIADEVVSRHPEADSWTVVDAVKLIETPPPTTDSVPDEG